MNERIRDLEDQCWEDIPVDIDYDYLSRVRRVFNREKFAELIVRECAKVADDGFASSNFGNGITGHQLLKHFGVEE